MNHPWMIVVGSALAGWLLAESFAVFGRGVPIGMNFLGAAACALIAAGIVL